jgi:hypothetical protein
MVCRTAQGSAVGWRTKPKSAGILLSPPLTQFREARVA